MGLEIKNSRVFTSLADCHSQHNLVSKNEPKQETRHLWSDLDWVGTPESKISGVLPAFMQPRWFQAAAGITLDDPSVSIRMVGEAKWERFQMECVGCCRLIQGRVVTTGERGGGRKNSQNRQTGHPVEKSDTSCNHFPNLLNILVIRSLLFQGVPSSHN